MNTVLCLSLWVSMSLEYVTVQNNTVQYSSTVVIWGSVAESSAAQCRWHDSAAQIAASNE